MTFSLLKVIDLFQLYKIKKIKIKDGNPTTNARNFQFLVCLNDSFSCGILFHKKNDTKKKGNLRLFSQWKVQQWKLPISRKCNHAVGARTTRRGLGHVWYMGSTIL